MWNLICHLWGYQVKKCTSGYIKGCPVSLIPCSYTLLLELLASCEWIRVRVSNVLKLMVWFILKKKSKSNQLYTIFCVLVPMQSVDGEHHEKAVELLKAAQSSVKLVVRYTPKVLEEMEARFEKMRSARRRQHTSYSWGRLLSLPLQHCWYMYGYIGYIVHSMLYTTFLSLLQCSN